MQRIRVTRRVHCARPPGSCKKCKELQDEGPVIELIAPDSNEEQAARLIEEFFDAGGEKFWSEFRVLKTFASKEEAAAYAQEHDIKAELDE